MIRPGAHALVAALSLVLTPGLGLGQEVAGPPDDFALIGARVVIAAGNVLTNGTVVVRDGRITSVSTDEPPSDVIHIDASGMTVYPGLVDAATSAGLPSAGSVGSGFGGGRGASAEDPPPELQPNRRAVEALDLEAFDAAAFRSEGITTAGLAFQGGVFPGQVSVISTGAGDTKSLTLRAGAALQVALNRRRGAYPGTLMGALAYVEQSFEDARYDARVLDAFDNDPASAPRPSYDAEHAAIMPAATGEMPVWIVASRERDFARSADLLERVGVTDYVILGGQEAYRDIATVAGLGRPVILGSDVPDLDRVTGRSFELHVAPVAGEDAADAEADSVVARALRGNAVALNRAGVEFAFASYGSSVRELRANVRHAIAAGLDPDAALSAVTLTPARILGIENAVGTIESGKFANLVVADGDLFAESTRIRAVYVEGVRFDVATPSENEDTGPERRGRRPGDTP